MGCAERSEGSTDRTRRMRDGGFITGTLRYVLR
jgi:hypothetical protein